MDVGAAAAPPAPIRPDSASSGVPCLRGELTVSSPTSTLSQVQVKKNGSFSSQHGAGTRGRASGVAEKCVKDLKSQSYALPGSVYFAQQLSKINAMNAFPPMFHSPTVMKINVCKACRLYRCMNHNRYCIRKNQGLNMCETCQVYHCMCLKGCINKTQGLNTGHTCQQQHHLNAERVKTTQKVNSVQCPMLRRPLKRPAALDPLDSMVRGSLADPLTMGRDHHAKFYKELELGKGHFAKRQKLSLVCPLEDTVVQQNEAVLKNNPLAGCLHHWKECGAHPWVLNTVEKGYKLQFAEKPPTFEKVLFSQATGQAGDILQAEITSLLSRNAIREVPLNQSRNGFYSRYFLVGKKGGGVRPILDLRQLNRFLKKFRFRMLTNVTLLRMMRPGDWYTTLDLKDAYHHVGIYHAHRKFLRFGFRGRVYESLVLPFGLSLSPRVFVKCTQAALMPLRQKGIRIASYIDDWIICASSEAEAIQHTKIVVDHVISLGFTVNYEKSVLVPSRSTEYIGLTLNSASFTARLSQERINNTLACAESFRVGQRVLFRKCQKMMGLMASGTAVLRLGRLYMKPFQRWMRAFRISNKDRHRKVLIDAECIAALQRWKDRYFLSEGVTMGLVSSRKIITTDASLTGWGATHEGRAARGVWDSDMQSAHINFLELMAVFLALQHFEPLITGCHVLVRTDNTTTKFYINKQGGLRSRPLHDLAEKITLWCDTRLKSIRASHVPGIENRGADLLSRGQCHYAEWALHDAVAAQLWDRFGHPVIDLFASVENAKCQRFFSLTGQSSLGIDALAQRWPGGLLYAFPPLALIPPFLERVRTQRLTAILIAPGWGVWRSEITPLLYDRPWCLPVRRDLLTQAKGEIFHPRPEDLDLWAWPVRG